MISLIRNAFHHSLKLIQFLLKRNELGKGFYHEISILECKWAEGLCQ